ncbi:MAG TPA: DNA-binding protein [Dehalococcoidia bacterium]|nr:DNA-binding protein [Dehalococcoidia bacterium]
MIDSTLEVRIIPSPVLVEVDYWVHERLRPSTFARLLRDIEIGAYVVENLLPEDYIRVIELTERYADSDIGFVDAAVLAIVERLREPKLATLDRRHFGLLRPRHVAALDLLPE